MTAFYDVGLVHQGEASVRLFPPAYTGGVRGVIFCHYNTGLARMALGQDGAVQTGLLCHRIAAAGFPLLSVDGGGSTWGSDTAISRLAEAVSYLQGPMGALDGKVLLVGVSMGNADAMAYTRANPSKVAGVLSVIPVCDVDDIYQSNRGGCGPAISGAYGGWSQATHGPAHNPITFASQLAGVPVRLYYSTADAVCLPAKAVAVAGACGGEAVGIGALTHDDSAVGAVPAADAVAWLKSHG